MTDDLEAFAGHEMKFALAGVAIIRKEIGTDL